MTVSLQTPSIEHEANGVTTAFAYDFKVLAQTDLAVYVDGTPQTLTTHYSVSGVGADAGGMVTFVSAPANGAVVSIAREMRAERTTDYQTSGDFLAATVNPDFDRAVMLVQDLQAQLARAVRTPPSELSASMVLPAAASRLGKFLRFHSTTGDAEVAEMLDGVVALSQSIIGDYLYPQTAGELAAGVTPTNKVYPAGDVRRYGAVGDGSNDDTTAFSTAFTAAYSSKNKTVFVPNGIYKITSVLTIGQGVMIDCEGSQGSTESYGTVFVHHSNGSCFRWDGSGADFAGTGGGLKNALIVKATGFSGGNAIELIATSDNKRPGEMRFDNVLSYGLGTGRWTRGLVIDGTACNTPGSRGVRTIHMTKCRFADVTTVGETVLLNQVAHFYAHGLAADTGSGSAAGIYLKGINDGVYLEALGCAGTFGIIANDASNTTDNLTISGKIGGAFTNNDTQVNGTAAISNAAAGIVNKAKPFKIVADYTSEFVAVRTSDSANATGDGTVFTVPFNSEHFDTLANFATDTFTCVIAGKYEFKAVITLSNLGAAHTRSDIDIVQAGSVSRAVTDVSNPYAQSASGFATRTIHCVLDLAHGDTVKVRAAVTGGTKTVGIYGAGTVYTLFSGKYLP